MALLTIKNNSKSTLNGGITNVATSITVTTGANFPASGDYMCTIWTKTTYFDPGDDPNMEIVRVTARSTNVLTVTRAQESTAGVAHNSGEAIEMLITAGTVNEMVTGAAADGKFFRGTGTTTIPAWSTATIPATLTSGQVMYASATNVMSGNANLTYASASGLTVNQASIGSSVIALSSTATNDDPTISLYQARAVLVGTGNSAEYLTAMTYAMGSTSRIQTIEAHMYLICTLGGDTWVAGEGCSYILRGTYKNSAGTLTLLGSVQQDYVAESQSTADATLTISSSNILVTFKHADTQSSTSWATHVDLWVRQVAT